MAANEIEIFTLFRQERLRLQELTDLMEENVGVPERARIFQELKVTLVTMLKVEQQIAECGLHQQRSGKEILLQGQAEWNALSEILRQLERSSIGSESWEQTIEELLVKLDHHFAWEDGVLFPCLRKLCSPSELNHLVEFYRRESESRFSTSPAA